MQNAECRMQNERTAKMREILFRGKRVDNGEWAEGSYLYCLLPNTDWTGQPKGKAEEVHYIVDKNNINYAVIPESVGQYTGLVDKKGKKIFEGDIVKVKDRLVDVCFEGYIDRKYASFVIVGEVVTHYRWLDYEIEVIGNIHDEE